MSPVRAPILDPASPGLYRNMRGIRGDDPMMLGDAPRVVITTGETPLPHAATPPSFATALDPSSVGFAVIVLLALLFVLHARLGVSAKAAIGTKG